MSKEDHFQRFLDMIAEYVGKDIVDILKDSEIIMTAYYSGYTSGYLEAIEEIGKFANNQVNTLQFEIYTQE